MSLRFIAYIEVMYDNRSIKNESEEIKIYCCKVSHCRQSNLVLYKNCGKLRVYIINPRAVTESSRKEI